MAKYNGKDKNSALIEAIEKNIKQLITTGGALPADDDTLVTIIDGVKIPSDEEAKYKKLQEITAILDFTGKDESELYSFADILLEKDKQEDLFKLVNSPEISSLAKNDKCPLVFPSVFGQYGEIPGLNGVTCPRPKSNFETVESYEEYLSEHYKKFGIQSTILENGMRAAFPHEKLEWVNGKAQTPSSAEYRSEYYKELKEKHEKTAKGGDGKDPSQMTEEEKKKAAEKAEERKLNRKKLERRVYPKERRTLREYLTGFGSRMRERNKALFSKENWPKIKKFLIGAAIATAAIVVLQPVIAPLMSSLLQGLVAWPQMLAYAFTGTATTSTGALVTLSVGERLAMGLVGAAVPVGLVAAIRKIAQRRKGKDPVPVEEPKGPTEDDDDEIDDDEEKGKDKGKGKGKEKDPDPKEPEITLPEGPLAVKKEFVQNKLREIKTEIEDIETQLTALKENPTNDTELMEQTLNDLRARINKLKSLREQYLTLFATLVNEVEYKAATEGPEVKAETGGLNL